MTLMQIATEAHEDYNFLDVESLADYLEQEHGISRFEALDVAGDVFHFGAAEYERERHYTMRAEAGWGE